MGKTTLIKHLAYTITQGIAPANLGGYLPIIIFLKELWPIYKEKNDTCGTGISFEILLKTYLEKTNCPISLKIVSDYISENRMLFLFDGLVVTSEADIADGSSGR